MSPRASLVDAKRLLVKVGSRSLLGASLHDAATASGGRFDVLAAQVLAAREGGRAVMIVSSGAVALGRGRLGFEARPRTMAQLQACAAVGQTSLMRGWDRAFEEAGVPTAQVLLSHADLADRPRYLNARRALDAVLELGAIPIINENDTVAVDEIRFGDNDQLAAMVSTLAGVDLMVMLTDVEGLLDDDGARVSIVEDAKETAARLGLRAEAKSGEIGSGGMGSKLEAARRAARGGVPVVLGDARDPEALSRILAGEDVGTLILPHGSRLASRKHWIAYTLRPRGEVILDTGAVAAVRDGGRSLLPAGVLGVRGDFAPGDAVILTDMDGREIARGLVRYGTADVARLAGMRTEEIQTRLGYHGGDEIVHRDDLVPS